MAQRGLGSQTVAECQRNSEVRDQHVNEQERGIHRDDRVTNVEQDQQRASDDEKTSNKEDSAS